MSGISVKIPLSIDGLDGPYALNKTLNETVKQNLKMLLLTIPGERVMDPNFGIGIQRFLFENDTLDLRNRISDRMRKQVEEYMPFIKIRETILPSFEEAESSGSHMLSIEVKYFIEDLSLEDVLSISVSPYDSSENVFGS